ncbi:hypothetical protein C8R44DRAFT_984842 [Mycena epipterygia]|nr:hypothetical protein C8R44DRAFT_984842 [Mycena epipterygia]
MIRATFIENGNEPLPIRMALAAQSIESVSVWNSWLGGTCGLMFLIGDAVTVWRAWAILADRTKPILFVIFLFACSLGTCVAYNVLNSPPVPAIPFGSALYVVQYLGAIFPLATNVCAVGLIGYRTYTFHRFMAETLGPGKPKAGKMMLVLTESGVLCCIVQAINVALNFSNDVPGISPLDTTSRLWGALILFAILPLMIILIVNQQRSISDTIVGSQLPKLPAASSRSEPGTIVFAQRNHRNDGIQT